MKYKVIIFDADGVTIDSNIMFSQKLERDNGISLEKTRPFFKGVFQECLLGSADLKLELEKVIGDWGWKKSVDDMLEEWFEFENLPNKGMFDLIYQLRKDGVKCYLATNQEKYRAEYLRREMNFDSLFDGIFISAEISCKKKEPLFFEKIFSSFSNIEKDEVLFVDNEEENIISAEKFGINAHLFTNIEALSGLLAD